VIKKMAAITASIALLGVAAMAQEKAAEPEKKVEIQKESKNTMVEMQTNHGNIYLEILSEESPVHSQNFLAKVDAGKYNSLTFHRIVPGFVIQGGDPTGTGTGSMGADRLADEKGPCPPEVRGTMAMARSSMGASNCQFYINLKDNIGLDKQGFTTFAKVIKGMDVVDKISAVKTGPGDKPLEPVVMQKVQRVDKVPASAEMAAPVKDASKEK
jgi:cyclophilin family peptidyl-prolyl cis-trans isomerase